METQYPIAIPKYFSPVRVMADAPALKLRIADYFAMLQIEDNLPTPPGLAMAMGLSTFDHVLRIQKEEEQNPGTYDEEAMGALQYAKSMIEDTYIRMGLREAIPQSFTKFLLSAYFARSERIISEQTNAPDNNFQFNILGVSQPMPVITQKKPQDDIYATIEHQRESTYEEPVTIVIEGVSQGSTDEWEGL